MIARGLPLQESRALLHTWFPSEKIPQMNFPAGALTPSIHDSKYDNSKTQATDRVPETWGSNTPWQYDVPFQTALTPEPALRFRYSLPSPPLSPFAPPPPSAPNFAYKAYESTHSVFDEGTVPQDGRYPVPNNSRLDPGSYYDSALSRMDGQLGASLSRCRTGVVNQSLESQGMQSPFPYVSPNPPKCEGSPGYSSGHFPSGERDLVDTELILDSRTDSSSGEDRTGQTVNEG